MELKDLELILDGKKRPMSIPLHHLTNITDGFSQTIGGGGFGTVYKGLLPNGTIVAVKKSDNFRPTMEADFYQEVRNMLNVQHENIVRFLGYCSNTRREVTDINGVNTIVSELDCILCFEYATNGSLTKHINGELPELEWDTRYNIIKGICEGLCYLHKNNIVHRDLKPDNILLDMNMCPKIADFGLSRILDGGSSKALTTNQIASNWYIPPEFKERGEVSLQYDIYSLGIILYEIVTGSREKQNVENVLKKWRVRDKNKSDLYQVQRCIEAATKCVLDERQKRPTIQDIINMISDDKSTSVRDGLKGTDINEGMSHSGVLNHMTQSNVDSKAEIEDTQIIEARFPSNLHNCSPHHATRVLIATNYNAEYHSTFSITGPTYDIFPQRSVVPPNSKFSIFVTPRDQRASTTNIDRNIYMHMESVNKDLKRITDKKHSGAIVKDVIFKAVYANEEMPDIPLLQPNIKALCPITFDEPYITSVDMHPMEPWILFVYHGALYVWNYMNSAWMHKEVRMARTVYPTQIPANVDIAMFSQIPYSIIACGDGHLYQLNYVTGQRGSIWAHGCVIKSMVCHPNPAKQVVLTSDDSGTIKIWNWLLNWSCTQTLSAHSGAVEELKINKVDDNIFASASCDGTVKVWNLLGSIYPTATLDHRPSQVTCIDFVPSQDKPWLISGSSDKTIKVWDYQTMVCLQTLEDACAVRSICCHPMLPIVFSGLADGIVRVWNSTLSPYRIENSFAYSKHGVRAMQRMGSKRVIVGYNDKALLLETHGD